MPSGSSSDSDCIAPHPLPHTSRLPSSHVHNLRADLSRSRNPSTQTRAGRLLQTTQGAEGVWSKRSWLQACYQETGVKGPHHKVGWVGWAEGSLITLRRVIQPQGHSFQQQPTLHTSIWLWHFHLGELAVEWARGKYQLMSEAGQADRHIGFLYVSFMPASSR